MNIILIMEKECTGLKLLFCDIFRLWVFFQRCSSYNEKRQLQNC